MADKIRVTRGNEVDIPVLDDGELGVCTDTNKIFYGSTGNKEIANKTDLDYARIKNNYLISQAAEKLKRRIKNVTGVSDSAHFGTYTYDKCFDGSETLKNTATGWLVATAAANKTIKFNAPTGVIIGDSIALGSNSTYGRLWDSGGNVDLNYANEVGQFSYHLEQYLKIRVYNHGIPGQTCTNVLTRWNRDVLALVDGGLTPTQTLSNKPAFCLINVGVNDVAAGRSISDITTDLLTMINSCISNNIFPIVNTIAPYSTITAPKLVVLKGVNTWLKKMEIQLPSLKIMDWYDYINDPLNDGAPKAGYLSDGTHPYKNIYQAFSLQINQEAFITKYPAVKPEYVCLTTHFDALNPATDVDRAVVVAIYIDDVIVGFTRLKNNPDQIIRLPIEKISSYFSTVSIKIHLQEVPIELSGASAYVGFGEIWFSDVNLFPDNLIDDKSEIISYPCSTAGIHDFFPVIKNSGKAYYTAVDADTNVFGIFAVTSTSPNTLLVTNGYCMAIVTGTVAPGDILITKGANNCLQKASDTPTVGTKVAQVVKGTTSSVYVKLL